MMAQRQRLFRAAGLLALEYDRLGRTPDGWAIAHHQEVIATEAIEQAENMAATGAMRWTHAASMIAERLEENVQGLQEVNTP
ncbi:hypothetical protein [Brevibacterium permense]|uniref:hypothetical protein n=1 Tax=Brevibacterium permense TaxID=234834 RepID=UPI0021CE9C9F|nr:hypothetical protein [Brevibacterium permense]